MRYQKDGQEAAKHFEAVLKKDAGDAFSWYWLGTLKTPASDEQSECYEKALKLNRHLSGAIYGLAMNLRRNDAKAAERFLAEHEALNAAQWQNVVDVKYSQMGPYAEAIGRTGDPLASPRTGPLPLFQPSKSWEVKLVPGARWARADDFGKDAVGEVRR